MVSTIDITFLGTGSCYPSPYRGASSLVLRLDGDCWMFDCGEGTQIQYQNSSVKPGRLSKIFITHLHGDHLFGLPGLMCLVQGGADPESPIPLDIYGPVGLAEYVRTSLTLSGTDLIRPYTVHEIAVRGINEIGPDLKTKHESSVLHPSERKGDVIEMVDGKFSLFETKEFKVEAGPLVHRLPCVGFVITEAHTPGSLDVSKLKLLGVKPGPLYGRIKGGHTITNEEGQEITPDMVVGPEKPGRKIVILGDTCDNTGIEEISRDADVVVHEATHQDELEMKAVMFGHSTPRMAAEFCQKVNARSLILTHFSQRYLNTPDECREGEVSVKYLVKQAEREGLEVAGATDLSNHIVKKL